MSGRLSEHVTYISPTAGSTSGLRPSRFLPAHPGPAPAIRRLCRPGAALASCNREGTQPAPADGVQAAELPAEFNVHIAPLPPSVVRADPMDWRHGPHQLPCPTRRSRPDRPIFGRGILPDGHRRADERGGAPTQARSVHAPRSASRSSLRPFGTMPASPAPVPPRTTASGLGKSRPSIIWPATTATEPASSGTGPSGSMALPTCRWLRSRTLRCMPCRVWAARINSPGDIEPCACMAFPSNC